MESLRKTLKKKGFWDTLIILSIFDHPIKLKRFYALLQQESYYNSYYRIKDFLKSHKIIEINSTERTIALTERGQQIKEMLIQLNELMED